MRDAGGEQAWIQHFEGAFRSRGAVSPKALTPPYVPFQNDDAMLGVLLEARPEVVSFHFGLPREGQLKALHPRWHPDPCERYQRRRWPGGPRRGGRPDRPGHRGGGTSQHLLFRRRQRARHRSASRPASPLSERPLIAAGGVMTGLDLQALLSAGADAVQLGTAFLLCPRPERGQPTAPA